MDLYLSIQCLNVFFFLIKDLQWPKFISRIIKRMTNLRWATRCVERELPKVHLMKASSIYLSPMGNIKIVVKLVGKGRGGSVMVWEMYFMIFWDGIGSIIQLHGKVNANVFEKVLQQHVVAVSQQFSHRTMSLWSHIRIGKDVLNAESEEIASPGSWTKIDWTFLVISFTLKREKKEKSPGGKVFHNLPHTTENVWWSYLI